MKPSIYQQGIPGVKWGIWNGVRKKFILNICEDTPMLAEARLFQIMGDNARKWRYEAKRLPKKEG